MIRAQIAYSQNRGSDAPALLLLAIAYTGGYAAGVPALEQAVRAFRGPAATPDEQLRWLWPAAHVAMALWTTNPMTCCPRGTSRSPARRGCSRCCRPR